MARYGERLLRHPEPPQPRKRPEPAKASFYGFAIILVVIAGAVDAIGFLHFRTFYVSFMSGNTTRTAVALAEGDFRLVGEGAAILIMFVAGVVGGDLLTGAPPRRRMLTLLCEAVVLLGAAALAPVPGTALPSSLLLALAMGTHNAVVLRAERISVALTYVTGTLVHVGRALAARLVRRPSPGPVWPYIALWLSLFLGAVLGAMSARASEFVALASIAGALAVLSIIAWKLDQRRA